MDLSESVLGSRVASYIRDRADAPLLTIGADTFDKALLSSVRCFNFLAAANLSALLAGLGAKDTRDVFDRIHPRELAIPRLGGVTLAVLGAAFQAKKLGGATPLKTWYLKHMLGNGAARDATAVQFSSLKRKDQDGAAQEAADRKSRKRARRAQAHRLRTERFEARKKPS